MLPLPYADEYLNELTDKEKKDACYWAIKNVIDNHLDLIVESFVAFAGNETGKGRPLNENVQILVAEEFKAQLQDVYGYDAFAAKQDALCGYDKVQSVIFERENPND